MQLSLMNFVIMTLLICVCTSTSSANSVGKVTKSAEWHPKEGVIQTIQDSCRNSEWSKHEECVAAFMRKFGASREAIDFIKYLKGEGWISTVKGKGKVNLIYTFYPFRANTNEGLILVNGKPSVIDLEDMNLIRQIDIRQDRLYGILIKEYPKLELWPIPTFDSERRNARGGQTFIISYPLLNGCHACEVCGKVLFAFVFDGAGKYYGSQLIRIERSLP
jgi:hypothetical protein